MKDLDWSNLSFGYRQTDYNVRCYYRDGTAFHPATGPGYHHDR